jgi:hypothetical protein
MGSERGRRRGEVERTFPPNPLMQFNRIFLLDFTRLQEVNVDVETAAFVLLDGVDEGGVGAAEAFRGEVEEGFAVGGFLAGRDGVNVDTRRWCMAWVRR